MKRAASHHFKPPPTKLPSPQQARMLEVLAPYLDKSTRFNAPQIATEMGIFQSRFSANISDLMNKRVIRRVGVGTYTWLDRPASDTHLNQTGEHLG